MNNKALALLIILQAIRANRSIHPSNDVEGIGGAEASSCTLARSIDRSGRNGSFSNETQFCEAWKGTKKNFENGSYHETVGKFPVCAGLTSDGISHMLRFTPNFTFVQNAECREQVNVFLRELRNYKFWAMEMLDSNAKLPSSLLQGNVNQLGDFDQCLNVAARERWNGREIRIKGRYFLTLIDVDATHPITERLVFVMKAHNIFLSNLHEKRGHFFPKFPLIRWALCLPSACSNEDARSVIQHALNEYNSTAGIRFMVRADPNTSYVKHESSNYTKETIYVLCFFAIVACLVAATTMRDYLGTRGEKEKENSLERIAMGFSLRRSAKSLFKKETGPNDITCIHGMKSILAVLLSMAHRNMTLCIMPYMNRIYYSHVAKEPLSVIIRLAMIYTDSFLLFSGTLISFNMTHELTTRGEIRWFRRLVSRYVRLTPMLLVVVLYYAYVMEHTGSGPEWNINVKNADLCKKTGWMNLLYAQIFLPFEDQCASHTYQVSIDMQLSLLAPVLVFVLKFWPTLGILLALSIVSLSTILRYTIMTRNDITIMLYYGLSVEKFYSMSNLIYTIPFYRITPYVCGVALSVLLYRVGKHVKIPKLVVNLGWSLSAMIITWMLYWPRDIMREDYVFDIVSLTNFVVINQILWTLAQCWIIFACYTNNGGVINKFLSHHWFVVFSKISYSFYLIQFIFFFYEIGTIRYPDIFYIFQLINFKQMILLTLSSIVLTLIFDISMQEIKNYIMKK
ncbi:nose resistant to fluoxetine protein 6 [Apis mellifera carnica]|nr:nose resistant to fluoxetine protein 6 [Apis mellifera carnica]